MARIGYAYVPTDRQREQVREWATNGVSQERIASALQISPTTLRAHYREELDATAGVFEARLEEALCSRALKADCPPAILIFTAKVRLRYRELVAEDPDRRTLDDLSDAELASMVGARARERRQSERGSAGDPAEETRAA